MLQTTVWGFCKAIWIIRGYHIVSICDVDPSSGVTQQHHLHLSFLMKKSLLAAAFT